MHLIVGGSGTLGSLLLRRLLAAGEPVRVMTRTPEKLAVPAHGALEVVRGDLLDHASLMSACSGARSVVAAAHSLFGRGRNASIHVGDSGHRALFAAAAAASRCGPGAADGRPWRRVRAALRRPRLEDGDRLRARFAAGLGGAASDGVLTAAGTAAGVTPRWHPAGAASLKRSHPRRYARSAGRDPGTGSCRPGPPHARDLRT